MERSGVDAGEAFERLRRAARTSRRTAAEVARTVLDGHALD